MLKKLTAGFVLVSALFAASAAPKVTMSGPDSKSQEFDTIQSALNAISGEGEYKIQLPEGTYEEVLYYKGPATVILSGNSDAKYGEKVVIAKDNSGDLGRIKIAGSAQKNRCLFEFDGTGNLILENLTLHNTFVRGSVKGSNTQAETLGFDSTGYVAAYNCSFKSHQDTLRTTGKTWFYNCYVEGDTDFIWMEVSAKVALFEKCEIYSCYDEKHKAHTSYIGAPRMAMGPVAGKGLVIFNSKISADERQTTYLGRSPWSSGYYSQIAYVNSKLSGITAEAWYNKPLMAPGVKRTTIGWKLDEKSAKSMKLDTENRDDILSKDEVKAEFAGRDAILNRNYDLLARKYRKDSDFYFDAAGVAAKMGWKISKDKSSALLPGEIESKVQIIALDGTNDASLSNVKFSGFAKEEGKPHFQGSAGDTITIPLEEKAIVTLKGYYAGSGTIKAGTQGEEAFSVATGTTESYLEKSYVVYQKGVDLTIQADEKAYLTQIKILYDKDLNFYPIEKIEVKSHRNKTEVAGRKTLQMYASLNPENPTNAQYVWSVSDPSVASIDPNGFLKANAVTEDTVIKVIATARDEKKVFGEKEIKVLKPEAGAFSVTWLENAETVASLEGTSDNVQVVKAEKAIPSKGTWKHNVSKMASDIAKGSLSYTGYSEELVGRKIVYIDFPITAVEKFTLTDISVAYGNHGTSNIGCHITYSKPNKSGTIKDDDTRKIRQAKNTYKITTSIIVEKGETINVRVALYGLSGGGDIAIPTGKAPTIGTVVINGKQIK